MFLHDHCLVCRLCSTCNAASTFRHDRGCRRRWRPLRCRETSRAPVRTRWTESVFGVHTRLPQQPVGFVLLLVIPEASMKPSVRIVRVLFDRSQHHLQSLMLWSPRHSVQNTSVDPSFIYPLVRCLVACRPGRCRCSRRGKSRESFRDPNRCSAPSGGRSRSQRGTRRGRVPRTAGEGWRQSEHRCCNKCRWRPWTPQRPLSATRWPHVSGGSDTLKTHMCKNPFTAQSPRAIPVNAKPYLHPATLDNCVH